MEENGKNKFIKITKDNWKEELKKVCDKLKEYKKKYNCARRSGNSTLLKVVLKQQKNIYFNYIKMNGKYIKSEEMIIYQLIKQKIYIEGFRNGLYSQCKDVV